MVTVDPWLSTLRSLAVEVVTLVLCQVLVGLPSWGCSASGFLGPAVFLVFTMGSPVSGRDCVLPQSAIVTLLSLLLVGLPIGLRAGSPALGCRCGLQHALVRAAVPPSHGSVLLLRPGFLFSGPGWCGRLPPCSFSSVFLRDVVTLWGQ